MNHKRGVLPIERPAPREKAPRELKRSRMKRRPSKLKRGPVGHASPEQKAKVDREGPRVDRSCLSSLQLLQIDSFFGHTVDELGPTDPAHITPRPHGGCDDELCVCPLPRRVHDLYDEGKFDLLPYLTLEEQAHAVSHLGILGALKRTTGEDYAPETGP
jgi:hypothetical protein